MKAIDGWRRLSSRAGVRLGVSLPNESKQGDFWEIREGARMAFFPCREGIVIAARSPLPVNAGSPSQCAEICVPGTLMKPQIEG